MAECIVAIDHITSYAVQAEDEVTAIDLVLEGEGLAIASETRNAYITEDQSSDSRAGSSMNISHDFHNNNSFEYLIVATYIHERAVR
jgi:hypothetical protein